VDQEFHNPNPSRIEGSFVFPVPKGAHLDRFTMDIDGKQVEAELLSADKARHIYEDIVRKMRDPALLEYAGRDLFKVRIFPIEPHGRKRIKLSYTQLLKADAGLIDYSLPLNTEKFSAKPIRNLSVRIDLETKRPLKTIYSPTHAVEVKRHGNNSATASYEPSDVLPDSDLALYFSEEKDEIGLNFLTYRASGEDGYFLALASPGVDVKEKQVVMKDIAFVLDTSGSMAGKKIDQAKKALRFCVDNLNDGDRFEILRFSSEVEPLFDKLAEASSQNRSRAEEFVNSLKALGGTAIDDALRKALKLHSSEDENGGRPFFIVFLTDGMPTVGTTDEEQIVAGAKKQAEGGVRIFSFGIGTDVNTHLLDRISETTRGFSQYVLPDEDLEVKLSSFYSKIKEPVLANPSLKFTGEIHTSKLYHSPLPDMFKGEQLLLVGRYSGKGASAIRIEGAVNGEPRRFDYDVKVPEESSENDFIPRLWAMRRIGYLLDEIRLHGENSELRDEVTELARKYGIVTPYTAYLISEDESRREVPVPMQSFPRLRHDADALQEGAATWNDFQRERGGEKAVAGARFNMSLNSAQAPAAAAAAGMLESKRALGLSDGSGSTPGGADTAKDRLVQYSQQTRFVAGKSFFLNGNQWMDSEIQKHANAKRVRIQFGSSEYFDLIGKNPVVSQWLALGDNLQFVLGQTIYEIYE
jgi:Ca-activated chloride channel family protein